MVILDCSGTHFLIDIVDKELKFKLSNHMYIGKDGKSTIVCFKIRYIILCNYNNNYPLFVYLLVLKADL